MNRAHVALIIVVAVAARAAVGLGLEGRVHFPDSNHYLTIARNIRAGAGPRLSEHTAANRPPGYPYFLAAILSVFQGRAAEPPLIAVRLSQAALGGALCLIIYLIGAGLFTPRAGLAAAVLVALDPFMSFFSGLILTEALFALLLAAGVLCLLKAEGGKARWAAACGVLLGGAALVRASALPLIPLLTAAWVLLKRKNPGIFRQGLIIVGVALAAMAPWAARNYRLTGRVVFTTLSSGASIYEATYPGADGGPAMDKIDWPTEIKTMAEAEKDDFLRARALEFVKADPLRIVLLGAVKLRRFWSFFPNFSEYRRPIFMAISALYMAPVITCVVAGIFVARKKPAAVILLLPAIYFSGLHAVFVGSIRYRAPIMPLLVVFAGGAVAAFIEKMPHGAKPTPCADRTGEHSE